MQAFSRYVTCVCVRFHLGSRMEVWEFEQDIYTELLATCLQYPFCGKSEVLSAAAALSAFNCTFCMYFIHCHFLHTNNCRANKCQDCCEDPELWHGKRPSPFCLDERYEDPFRVVKILREGRLNKVAVALQLSTGTNAACLFESILTMLETHHHVQAAQAPAAILTVPSMSLVALLALSALSPSTSYHYMNFRAAVARLRWSLCLKPFRFRWTWEDKQYYIDSIKQYHVGEIVHFWLCAGISREIVSG